VVPSLACHALLTDEQPSDCTELPFIKILLMKFPSSGKSTVGCAEGSADGTTEGTVEGYRLGVEDGMPEGA